MGSIKQVLDMVEVWDRQRKAILDAVEAGRVQRSKVLAFANPPPHDPWRLLSRRYSSKQRLATARAVAARMSTRFKDPRVVAAIREHRSPDRWLREQVFPEALWLAAAERYKAQPIRLGKHWVGGRRQPVIPLELAWPNAIRWLRQRARRLAEEIILDEAPRVRLSPRERDLFRHLQATAASPSTRAAAEALGIDRSTIRTMRQRLFRKGGKVQ